MVKIQPVLLLSTFFWGDKRSIFVLKEFAGSGMKRKIISGEEINELMADRS